MNKFFTVLFILGMITTMSGQDKVVYKNKKNGFYQDSIQAGIQQYEHSKNKDQGNTYLSIELEGSEFPTELSQYETVWHNAPLSQGATGTCWCFASLSFLESEIKRITGNEVKLSEIYVVYWEYVARARYFVQQRGDMYFGQGSESNATIRIIKEHGLVPAGQYSGLLEGQRFHNHGPLAKEIKNYLSFVKKNNIWDENTVVNNVRSILDFHLGTPPEYVVNKGEKVSPLEYMHTFLNINPNDYFSFMSTKSENYNEQGELKEPDNWWHCKDYYNVHLDDFSQILLSAIKDGYTVSLCGDVSEPGYNRYAEIGIIPSFDIPEEYINEDSREFRIYNGSTTDDHCVHIVGYTKENGKLWYLIKDSSSSGFDGPNKGYRFMRQDYIELKVLALMMHKYAAKEVLDNIIK